MQYTLTYYVQLHFIFLNICLNPLNYICFTLTINLTDYLMCHLKNTILSPINFFKSHVKKQFVSLVNDSGLDFTSNKNLLKSLKQRNGVILLVFCFICIALTF